MSTPVPLADLIQGWATSLPTDIQHLIVLYACAHPLATTFAAHMALPSVYVRSAIRSSLWTGASYTTIIPPPPCHMIWVPRNRASEVARRNLAPRRTWRDRVHMSNVWEQAWMGAMVSEWWSEVSYRFPEVPRPNWVPPVPEDDLLEQQNQEQKQKQKQKQAQKQVHKQVHKQVQRRRLSQRLPRKNDHHRLMCGAQRNR